MEEPHHVKMQTLYSGDDPSMHTEKYNIPDRDLGVNSILVDESHRVMTRETYSKDDLSIHMEEESSKLERNLNIPTSQRDIERVHKAGRIPGSNMFKHEEIKAQTHRLYKSALRWKHRVESGQLQNVDKEKDHSYLMTIPEETETNGVAVPHDMIQTRIGIHLKQEADITDTFGYQNTKLLEDYVGETEQVTLGITEDRRRNMSKFDIAYVNGQEVLAAFDSCSTSTLIHRELTDTIGIKNQGNFDHKHETWLENLLQPDDSLLDTEIDTETPCTLYTKASRNRAT